MSDQPHVEYLVGQDGRKMFARRALAAAAASGLGYEVVRTTTDGFLVPEEVSAILQAECSGGDVESAPEAFDDVPDGADAPAEEPDGTREPEEVDGTRQHRRRAKREGP